MRNKTTYDYAVEFFKIRAGEKREAFEELKKHDKTVQFKVPDEGSFVMEVRGGQATFEKGEIEMPDIEVEADSQTFISIFHGQMTPAKAFLDGKLLVLRGWVDKTRPYFPWLTKTIRIVQGR